MVVMPVIHRAIGRRALAHLVLTAERINAVKALEVGLVTKVFAKSDLETQTNAIAVQVASLAPEAACIAKKLLYQVGENDYQQLLQQLPQKIAALSLEPEAHEGITAFLQKRRPQWGK